MNAWETRAIMGSVVVAFLPTLLLLGWTCWRRVRRGADAPSIGVQGVTTSSAAAKGVLHAARASAAGRRLRVSFVMGQAGYRKDRVRDLRARTFQSGIWFWRSLLVLRLRGRRRE